LKKHTKLSWEGYETRTRIRTYIELEIESVYRFPVLEIVVAFILFVVLASSIGSMMSYSINIGRYPTWDGTAPSQNISDYVSTFPYLSMYSLFIGIAHPLTLLIPIIAAIAIAGCMEDNTLKTMLSYPIRRRSYLSIKVIMAIIIPSIASIAGILISIFLFVPVGVSNIELLLLILSTLTYIVLLVSFGTIMSIAFKRVSVSAVGGVGFWYVLQLLISLSSIREGILLILDPLRNTAASLVMMEGASSIGEIPFILMGSLGLALVIFFLAFMIFERTEI